MKRTIFAVSAFIIGLVLLGFAFGEWREDRKIDKQGVEVTVAPPATYQRIKKRLGDKYRVDLKFITPAGKSAGVTRLVSRNVIDKFESAQPVKLKYLADDMSMARVNGEGSGDLGITIAFALFFIVVGSVMFRGRNEAGTDKA